MDDMLVRLSAVINVVLPLLLFMAWVYLALHMLAARLVTRSDSPVLWFFAVVTGPLTRPVRRCLPGTMPEPRVRAIAFAVYLGLWLVVRTALLQLGIGRHG